MATVSLFDLAMGRIGRFPTARARSTYNEPNTKRKIRIDYVSTPSDLSSVASCVESATQHGAKFAAVGASAGFLDNSIRTDAVSGDASGNLVKTLALGNSELLAEMDGDKPTAE
jgi:FAD/FMN-containing dehydrogenase